MQASAWSLVCGWLSKHYRAKPSKQTSCSLLQKISEVRQSTAQQQTGSSKSCTTWGHSMKPNKQPASCAGSPRLTRKRPLGSISTLPAFRELLRSGWPQLDLIGDTLHYSGPLPKDCLCAITHKPMVGLPVWSSASPSLSDSFGSHTGRHSSRNPCP